MDWDKEGSTDNTCGLATDLDPTRFVDVIDVVRGVLRPPVQHGIKELQRCGVAHLPAESKYFLADD